MRIFEWIVAGEALISGPPPGLFIHNDNQERVSATGSSRSGRGSGLTVLLRVGT